jgi:hypothetical protein
MSSEIIKIKKKKKKEIESVSYSTQRAKSIVLINDAHSSCVSVVLECTTWISIAKDVIVLNRDVLQKIFRREKRKETKKHELEFLHLQLQQKFHFQSSKQSNFESQCAVQLQ